MRCAIWFSPTSHGLPSATAGWRPRPAGEPPRARGGADAAASEAPLAVGAALERPWATGPDVLEPRDRLDLERVLLWLRLSFLAAAVLPPLAFGLVAVPYALLIGA